VTMGPNGILMHAEGQRSGAFETLYDVEVEGFIKYCDTHVFKKTSEYEIPEVGKDGKGTGKKILRWRAEIESVDPGDAGGARALHDEQEVVREVISNYVWIVPAQTNRSGGIALAHPPSDTIAEFRKRKEFTLDTIRQPAKAQEPPKDPTKK
jgi:hypothetical protein